MNGPDTSHAKTRFSIRSLLTLMAFAALVFVALKQHQQNQQMQRQLHELSSQLDHVVAYDEDLRVKFEVLRDIVSNEPTMKVPPLTQN